LHQAVSKWLQWEDEQDSDERDNLLLNLSVDNIGEPEQPEMLFYMREAQKLGVPVFAGDLWALPYVFRLELHACLDAEQEQLEILKANLRIAAEFADGQKDTGHSE